MCLRALLKQVTLGAAFTAPSASPHLALQFSSLGSIDDKWFMEEFSTSLLAEKRPPQSGLLPQALRAEDLYLVWPTVKQIQGSLEGWAAGRSVR